MKGQGKMAKKEPKSLFGRLTKLFRSGPIVKRKIRNVDTTLSMADKTKSSGALLFQKSLSPTYATITSNAYNLSERLMRYQDFVEMEYTPEIASALDIYADEAWAQDEKGRALHIYSENEKIKEILEDLFYNTLNVEFMGRSWVRNLVKYGDFFLYNDVSPEYGVLNAFPIPVNEIEREENYDREDPMAVRYRWVTMGNRTLENWEVTHFRLLGNDTFLPYGSSVIEPARRIWRQLILIEDAMLVYRVVRAPERRVFYIDVANVPPENVPMYIEEQRKRLRTSSVIDNTSGRVDLRYNPLSIDEDYFIPVRGSDTGTKIDTLAGGQNAAAVEDVAYIQKKLFAALKVPRAYLNYDEGLSCVVPETKVDLLDGRTLTLEEIKTELDAQKSVWVYSVDKDTQEMRPGRVIWCGPTRKNADLVRVTLDNGESFTTTPDHKWMLRDGSWCEASQLSPGSSLMPVHKRKKSMNGGGDYEQVFDPATGKWMWTHKMVSSRTAIEKHVSFDRETKTVVHHKDVDRFNNNPENLMLMGFEAHRKHHVDLLSETRKKASALGLYSGMNNGKAKSCREAVQHLWSMQSLITWCQENRPTSLHEVVKGYGLPFVQLRRLLAENAFTFETFATNYVVGGYKLDRKGNKGTHTHKKHIRVKGVGPGGRGAKFEVRACSQCGSQFDCTVKSARTFCDRTCSNDWHRGKEKNAVAPRNVVRPGMVNHKVVSVVYLDEKRDTWCMEVAETHTFGLSNGTIISNSKASLSQEDIRFSRTISVIQRTIVAELNKLAIIHLYANGFDADDLQNFTLRLSNPSTVAQQQKLELWRAKFEIGSAMPETMGSAKFVQREIWGLTNDEIEEMQDERLEERKFNDMLEMALDTGGDAPAGGDDLFGGDAESDSGAARGDELPPEENAGEAAPEEEDPSIELLTAADDKDDNEDFALKVNPSGKKGEEAPVKPSSYIDRTLYNRSRRRTHGASKTFMPDLNKMTGNDNRAMKDPADMSWLKSVVSNPFGESTKKQSAKQLSSDVVSMLRQMSSTLKMSQPNFSIGGSSLLAESADLGEDVQDEIDDSIVDISFDDMEAGDLVLGSFGLDDDEPEQE